MTPAKAIFPLLVALFLLTVLIDAQVIRRQVPDSPFESVSILYTANTRGLHAATQADAPASAMQTIISAVRKQNKDSLLVDLGNFMGATPTTILTQGRLDFQVMELLGYDLLHISSDEFVTGSENLNERIQESKIPVLAGNLVMPGSSASKWIILPCGSRKVGFVGVTSSAFPSLVMANTRKGVVIESPRSYIIAAMEAMEGKADIVVALTDLAEDEIAQIRDIPGLDLIITTGGDLSKPGLDWISVGFPGVRNAAVARTLSSDRAVHLLQLHGYPEQNKWRLDEIVGEVYKVTKETPRENATDNWFQWQIDNFVQINNKVLGRLNAPLPNSSGRTIQTPLGKAVTDLMRNASRSHLAILNSGALRNGLPAGDVTEWDLIEAIPYPNNLVVVKLKGAQIEALISKSQGKAGGSGYLQFSGLTTEPASLGDRIGGLPIVPDRYYTVTLLDFLAQGGEGYPELKEAEIVERIPISLQDLCRRAFQTYGSLAVAGLPMDKESNFWYEKFHVDATTSGFIADPDNLRLYPNELALVGQQLLSTSVNMRLDVLRRNYVSGLSNYIQAQFASSWDKDWTPTETLDSVQVGSQYSFYLSNLLFGGVKTLDPYVSATMETALFYPDPANQLFDPNLPRPGSLKVAGGMELTLLQLISLKLGLRWEKQPFDWGLAAVTGMEGILAFNATIITGILSLDTTTDVFTAFAITDRGITVSSVNHLFFTLTDKLAVGPRVQLFYNSLVGHLSYLFDLSVGFSLTF